MKLLQALPKDSTVFGKEQGGNGFKTQSRSEGSQNSERNLNMLTASPRLQNSKYANWIRYDSEKASKQKAWSKGVELILK